MCLRTTTVVLVLVALLPVSSLAIQYNYTTLGTLGGDFSTANAVNNRGQVVGYSFAPLSGGSFVSHAYIWDSVRGMRDLGTLGGKYSFAFDINDAGQVVGYSSLANGTYGAFVWDEVNGMRYLGTLGPVQSQAYGINNGGTVVGFSSGTDGYIHGFIWDPVDLMRDAGWNEFLNGVNAHDVAVGNDGQGAFLWGESTGKTRIAPSGSTWSEAVAINDAGQVAGNRRIGNQANGFFWDPVDGFTILETFGLSSNASGINSAGVVAGNSWDQHNIDHAFVWDNTHGMTELAAFGSSNGATNINDLGWVVGVSSYGSSNQRAVVWVPVPEPSSLLAFAVGLGGFEALLRRRRRWPRVTQAGAASVSVR